MTGSAFKAMDVVVACLSSEKGGGLEEGGLEIRPGGRAADDGLRVLGFFFSDPAWPLGSKSMFLLYFGGPWGVFSYTLG